MTINSKAQDKYLLGFMIKLSDKAKKVSVKTGDSLALALFLMFHNQKVNDKAKKIINHEASRQAELQKQQAIDDFVDKSRDNNEWFYLASSHNDCAPDHKAYQGRLYVDEKAPKDVIDYARSRGLYTVQWVMGEPAWFITRPNCRHYFISLPLDKVRGKSDKKLRKKYKTHSIEGNREFQTPKRIALDEYEDRLKYLKSLYNEVPNGRLKIEINKTRLLVEKWKKLV